ncbi:unnamed protein product [Urochloa decumbens]|uniref:Uncharacterized protein n=1 Tax=Urochloa decumbens TaxID=240449 RepID=A0ABC9D9D3_9POAL
MAEMVSSVIVKETVSQILSGLVHKCEGKEKSNANTDMERLEMAHIRLEAALEISSKWVIADASLLRWRKKLKLATQECDDALHKCKRRMLEEEQMEQEDFSWVPYVDSSQKDQWDNLHSFSSQWFRPNPLCCKQHEQHKFCHSRKVDSSGLQDVSLEPVIEVNLQCQVSFSEYNKQRTSMFQGKCSLEDSPHLKVGLLYTPHDSSEGLLPADGSSAATMNMIDGDKQHYCLHPDMTLEQVEEVMLPKAIGYFSQNTEATAYQMLWNSRCGTAYIQVEKASIFTPRTRRTFHRDRKRKLLQRHVQELENPSHVISRFVDLWATQAPIQLQVSIMDWFRKEKEMQLAPQPLRLKSDKPVPLIRQGKKWK